MEVIGHVTGGEDAGNIGATARIDQDSIPGRHPGSFDDFDVRFDPNRHDHEVTGNSPTFPRDDSFHLQRPLESDNVILGQQVDPCLAMNSAEHAAHFGAKDCVERRFPTHNRGHLQPQLAQ